MTQSLWQFAEIDAVYQRLRPLTPYGRRAFERRQLLTDAQELHCRYDRIEEMLVLIAARPLTADRIRFHLKRIPLLPAIAQVATAADLFLVKKFLANFKAVCDQLPTPPWEAEALLECLYAGNNNSETFFLSDGCSSELSEVRTQLRALDARIQQTRAESLSALLSRHGLDFSDRDFLVVDTPRVAQIPAEELFLEPFDSRHVIVKPVLPKRLFELMSQRDALAARKQEIENGIVAQLGAAVRDRAQTLAQCEIAIESLDVAFAAAELASALQLNRPTLVALEGKIDIEAARLIPLQENCAAQQVPYRPLTVCLNSPHALLHGCNMSGKSVVLKTVASLQLLAQLGLFVPADRFESVVFDSVDFIGAAGSEDARGLSSFGHEIVALQCALAKPARTRLLIIDEFARTTSSREAAALIAGLLKFLDASVGTHSLLATHYSDLPAFARVENWCMKRIDWDRLHCELNSPSTGDLAARIKAINRCVPYEMIPASDQSPSQDAIGIAEILGLDNAIVTFARKQLQAAQESHCRA